MLFSFTYQVISNLTNDWKQRLISLDVKSENISSEVLLAAAFSVYMGPYDEDFRKEMLTKHWFQCLANQGMPVDFTAASASENKNGTAFSLGLREVESNTEKNATPQNEVSTEMTDTPSHVVLSANRTLPYEDVFYGIAKNLTNENTMRRWLTQGFSWNDVQSLVLLNPPLRRAVYCIDPEQRLRGLVAEMLLPNQELVELDFSQRYVSFFYFLFRTLNYIR